MNSVPPPALRPSGHARSTVVLAFGAVAVLSLIFSSAAASQTAYKAEGDRGTCSTGRPVQPAPSVLWGELEPVGVLHDGTSYTGSQFLCNASRNDAYINFTDIDTSNGYVFGSFFNGFQVFDARTSPANPPMIGEFDTNFAVSLDCGEIDSFVYAVDVPQDDTSVLALGGMQPMGFAVFNTSSLAAPQQTYQDQWPFVTDIHMARIGSTAYAFAAADTGLAVYNATTALQYSSSACVRNSTNGDNCGVFVGKVHTSPSRYVDGVAHNGKYYVASSAGLLGLFLYDVTSPSSPVAKLSLPSLRAFGVALWEQNGQAYLAARLRTQVKPPLDAVQVFNVTSCLAAGCASLPAALASVSMASIPGGDTWKPVVFSRSGATPTLSVVGTDTASCGNVNVGTEAEKLLDVTNAASPRDITPTGTYVDVDTVVPGSGLSQTVDYWSWYYKDKNRGFAFMDSRGGKFSGSHFYRVARSIVDVHEWMGGGSAPPTANFSWNPSAIYPGDAVVFTDTSTGQVTSRDWTFQGGTPATSAAAAPSVTFAAAGGKTVSLTAGNSFGDDTETKTVNVLDPAPAIGGVSSSPPNPSVCQPVTLTASGVTGKPPLSQNWAVRDSAEQSVASGNSNPYVWSTVGASPGTYTATFTATNGTGSASQSLPISLAALESLPAAGFAISAGTPTQSGQVQFQVNTTGDTEWSWNYGDGQGFRAKTTDPVNGPNPLFNYTATGDYTVQLAVGNCQNPLNVAAGQVSGGVLSATIQVHVTSVSPLAIDTFLDECNASSFGTCPVGSVDFIVAVTGSPDTYQWDWTNDGSVDETGAPPKAHVYAAGNHTARLRILRGAESLEDTTTFNVSGSGGGGGGGGGGTSPSIAISGPTTGAPGQTLNFSASASNCTAAADGWSWNVGGGTGSSTTSQIALNWASTGQKSISVTNSGCSGASDSHGVNITVPTGQGGLGANFTVSPASPQAGQSVTLDASTSTGGATSWFWTFGDGQSALASTSTITHTFASPQTYQVKLEVAKPSTTCNFGTCTASLTKAVVVSGEPVIPPLQASFTSPACVEIDFYGTVCSAKAGDVITFTDTTAGATSHLWNFGDGGTAAGAQVAHVFGDTGVFSVLLTASNATQTGVISRSFTIAGPDKHLFMVPLVAHTNGETVVMQESDLYIVNPSDQPMDVTLTFRKRGTPEANPPTVERQVPAQSTLFSKDALEDLFNLAGNSFGLLLVEAKGVEPPLVMSYHTTFQGSSAFGQTIFAVPVPIQAPGGEVEATQYLIGLSQDGARRTIFGVSNAADGPAVYTVKAFDRLGAPLGSADGRTYTVSRFGQKLFTATELKTDFLIDDQTDFRVAIESAGGDSFRAFATLIEQATEDPSYVPGVQLDDEAIYLIGVLGKPGIKGSRWQSDLVVANPEALAGEAKLTYKAIGVGAPAPVVKTMAVPGGEVLRSINFLKTQLGLSNTAGVLKVESGAGGTPNLLVRGETYDAADPAARYGQSLVPLSLDDAAGTSESVYLVGLQEHELSRSVVWLFNPTTQSAGYDLVYRALDGSELGNEFDVQLGPGIARQLSGKIFRLPVAGSPNFTLEVRVHSGAILAAAQVVNNENNDPAYLVGVVGNSAAN